MPHTNQAADVGDVVDGFVAVKNSLGRKLDFSSAQTLTGTQHTTALANLGASAVGRQLVAAADAAAGRAAIGAGTSNLTIGTTSTTAKAGNYAPTTGEVRAAGGVTSVTVNGASYTPTAGVVDLGTIGGGGETPTATVADLNTLMGA